MLAWLKTVFVFFVVGLSIIILTPVSILCLLLSPLRTKRPLSTIIYRLAQCWALFLIKLTGCELKAWGQENIPKDGPVCFVSNHGSIFDIVLLLAYVGRPVGFIGKKELLLVPLLNIWIFLLGGLFIDRKKHRKAVRTIDRGVQHIREGHAMLIFPEGGRSRGKGLLPFHVGSFRLAVKSESTIVPVSIRGSYEVFEKNYVLNPGPVTISFMPPIKTAGLSAEQRKQGLADRVYAVIAESLSRTALIRNNAR
ncbi:MAG: 1-acyl-sn-glycerol-3-phosphate acyltransferase [Treponema sp.]|jgi:1-acyl-sn-glycerol-3-phosphate acyltransferase|nr:1-acyl-sn-glycerol-3-phosphate acyltransferase [Treponema sp.]